MMRSKRSSKSTVRNASGLRHRSLNWRPHRTEARWMVKKSRSPLILAGLLALTTGCRWIFKPTYPAKSVAQSVVNLCAKDHITVMARRKGDNLQAYFMRAGLFQSSRFDIKPEAADELDKVFAATSRVALSTDAPLNFIEVK